MRSQSELTLLAIARTVGPQTRYQIVDEMTAMLDINTQALI
ncbi:hypothetical protein [Pseudanabaena sp. FACHB-2040]|nr:hypothetical protein [Pseudanabaena sp. FACHB-2040]